MSFVDVRGTRFAGALTTSSALAVVATGSVVAAALLALVLLTAATGGPRWNLWSHIYRRLVAPRLSPPQAHQREPAGPPRFANLLGGVFVAGATLAYLGPLTWLGAALVLVVAALAALNATTGFCLGCKFYGLLVLRRRTPAADPAPEATP